MTGRKRDAAKCIRPQRRKGERKKGREKGERVSVLYPIKRR